MTKIIFFLLVSISAYSQNLIDLGTATWPKGLQYNTETAPFYHDTSKVLMLLCDTSDYVQQVPEYFGEVIVGSFNKRIVSNYVWYDWGYMVTSALRPISYLDKNKQPLYSKYVVWLIKYIK